MNLVDNYKKFKELRFTYQEFCYESYAYQLDEDAIRMSFCFSVDDSFVFNPVVEIPMRDFYKVEGLSVELMENLVFHIGMIELISYWKAACPKVIVIQPFKLTDEQIAWWKKLYFNGLGEFFYLNGIAVNEEKFVEIRCASGAHLQKSHVGTDGGCIVPVGGGKDSVVTLEMLKGLYDVTPMVINPRQATDECMEIAGFRREDSIIVHRRIDPFLLELNKQGFLNGHTPFSAVLAFVSLLTAAISGKGMIALSNESSANEATVKGLRVNHQYSKSVEFETDFRNYVDKYIVSEINYHSFLRPLQELQIGYLFSGYEQYFSVFKSCNVGSKTDIWCCSCPKCLFAFIILSPFIAMEKLEEIFGENLLDKRQLRNYFNQLIGEEAVKPFECIGTVEEVNVALCMIVGNYNGDTPYLLQYYKGLDAYEKYRKYNPMKSMDSFEGLHYLNQEEADVLKNALLCWNN